jgi:uncharacterized membrane protein YebE (DUF533 family)
MMLQIMTMIAFFEVIVVLNSRDIANFQTFQLVGAICAAIAFVVGVGYQRRQNKRTEKQANQDPNVANQTVKSLSENDEIELVSL